MKHFEIFKHEIVINKFKFHYVQMELIIRNTKNLWYGTFKFHYVQMEQMIVKLAGVSISLV